MSDTVFKSSSPGGVAEDVLNQVLPNYTETRFSSGAVVEQADAPLKIAGEQSIRNADELQKVLAEHLDRGLRVVLDLSEVQVCDATTLQLFCALRQSAIHRRQYFHITSISPAIVEAAAALGLPMEALGASCGPAVPQGDCEVAGADNGI